MKSSDAAVVPVTGPPASPSGASGVILAFRNIMGESAEIRHAVGLGRKVAEHPGTTVLLNGETGTGKELFARGIHYASANGGDPFVAVNCAAIPESLLESELFGHERGAFTDAKDLKRGLLELAGRGTVFLDEIGELPPALQPKLLRVLEEKAVRRVGGLEERSISCRIIAATNRNLAEAVAEGTFREDLYYRLNVFRIELPPLRERGNDVLLLSRHFIQTLCRDQGMAPKELSAEAAELLATHGWRGNIRELKNTIERALILSEGRRIEAEHILIQRRSSVPAKVAADDRKSESLAGVIRVPREGLTLEEAERQLLALTLRLADHNHTLAARMLGISRPTIIRKVRKYGLQAKS